MEMSNREVISRHLFSWQTFWSSVEPFHTENASVWNPAQSSGAGSSSDAGKGDVMTCHDWGFYQMK